MTKLILIDQRSIKYLYIFSSFKSFKYQNK